VSALCMRLGVLAPEVFGLTRSSELVRTEGPSYQVGLGVWQVDVAITT
jgi:hypothetical protein